MKCDIKQKDLDLALEYLEKFQDDLERESAQLAYSEDSPKKVAERIKHDVYELAVARYVMGGMGWSGD